MLVKEVPAGLELSSIDSNTKFQMEVSRDHHAIEVLLTPLADRESLERTVGGAHGRTDYQPRLVLI